MLLDQMETKLIPKFFRTRIGCFAIGFSLFIALPISLVMVARLGWTYREYLGRTEMHRRLNAMAEAGVPTDNQSVDDFYHSRTSHERSEQWESELAYFDTDEFKKGCKGVPIFDQTLDEDAAAPVQESWRLATVKFVERHQSRIATFRELCKHREPVYFPIYFDSVETLLPYTQHMRSVGRLFMADGKVAIEKRDSSRVRADIEGIMDSAIVCSAEPFLVSNLVCTALDFQAMSLLQEAIEKDAMGVEDLKSLLPRLIEKSALGDEWKNCIQGERSTLIPVFLNPPQSNRKRGNQKSLPARGWDCVYFLDYMKKLENIDASSLDSLLKESSDLESQIEKERVQGGWLLTIDSMLTYLMLPATKVYAETMVSRRMSYRIASTAVIAQIFAKTHSHYPNGLSELALPGDQLRPVGANPFGFKQIQENESVLWGFNVRKIKKTPDEPPPLDPPVNSSENQQWVWRLRLESPNR